MTVSKSINLKEYFYEKSEFADVATSGAYTDLTGTPELATVATTGAYSDLTGTPAAYTHPAHTAASSGLYKITVDALGHVTATTAVTASDLPSHTHSDYAVTVEKQVSADTGYAHTYIVKQNGAQVGQKINIPKDFLVKSATLETAVAADLTTLGNGFATGDKYIDFVVNTADNSGTDNHIYLNVKDLVDTYNADGTTITLNSSTNTFSIKAGIIPVASSTATDIKMNGTQSAGSADTFARADHVHPSDDNKVSIADLGLSYDSSTGVLSILPSGSSS